MYRVRSCVAARVAAAISSSSSRVVASDSEEDPRGRRGDPEAYRRNERLSSSPDRFGESRASRRRSRCETVKGREEDEGDDDDDERHRRAQVDDVEFREGHGNRATVNGNTIQGKSAMIVDLFLSSYTRFFVVLRRHRRKEISATRRFRRSIARLEKRSLLILPMISAHCVSMNLLFLFFFSIDGRKY